MKVLIACAYSGVERDEFARLGHNAWSCDLLPCETPGNHYQGDVLDILDEGWDLMIAHPDCTYLTNSAEWAYGGGPYHQKVKPETLVGAARRAARDEALGFVRKLFAAPIKRKCLENPRGAIGTRVRPASQWIQPHEYGHDASKITGLWLENLPLLVPTRYVPPRWVCCGNVLDVDLVGKYGCPNCLGGNKPKPRWANQTDSGQNKLTPGPDRWKERARTYSGWAEAMAAQWSALP